MTDKGFESMFIDEPSLTFGEGKEYIDPKWGLKAYGRARTGAFKKLVAESKGLYTIKQ